MGSRGESKSQKAVATEKVRFLKRKAFVWTIKNRTGPHSKKTAVPLGFLIRDMLGLAASKKETKIILNSGMLKVNGMIRKDLKFPAGLFDIVSFDLHKKNYRVVLDSKGRIAIVEMKEKALLEKVSKILKRKVSKKSVIEVTTNDGFVLKDEKNALKVSGSVKISLPGKKILQYFPFSVGKTALIIGGKHAGEVGVIEDITESSMRKQKLVKLKTGSGEFSTLENYVCVVGDNKTALEMNLQGIEK